MNTFFTKTILKTLIQITKKIKFWILVPPDFDIAYLYFKLFFSPTSYATLIRKLLFRMNPGIGMGVKDSPDLSFISGVKKMTFGGAFKFAATKSAFKCAPQRMLTLNLATLFLIQS